MRWWIPEKPEIASFRYRCEIPRRHMNGDYDVTIVAKDWIPLDELRGTKSLIWDCCDDHFRNEKRAYYMAVSEMADAIVVPTDAMKTRIKEETGRDAFVISDPYEFPLSKPEIPSGKARKLFWYGHKSNIQGLIDKKADFVGREVRAMSNWRGCIPWSFEGMLHCFAWCDAVPIPVNQDKKSQAKSPNRMVEAIRQGRYVIANPLEAYKPYGMWSGDLKEGFEWVDNHPDEALEAVRNAQEIVQKMHDPKIIAQQWESVCRSVATRT